MAKRPRKTLEELAIDKKTKKTKIKDISVKSDKECAACGRKRACLNKGNCIHWMNYLAYGDGYSK